MATFDLWWQHGLCKHWTYLLCLQESGQTGECRHVSVRTLLTVRCVLSLSLYRKLWSRDKSPTEWGRGAAPHRVEIPGPCSSGRSSLAGLGSWRWWVLTTECPIFPPWSPLTRSHRALVTRSHLRHPNRWLGGGGGAEWDNYRRNYN